MPPILQYGKFRGRGQVSIGESKICIQGKRVYSMGTQLLFGLLSYIGLVFVATLILNAIYPDALSGQTGLGILILIVCYVAPNYWILKKEDLTLPLSAISGLAEDGKRNIIAIAFAEPSSCSPIVIKTEHWDAVLQLLKRGMSKYSTVQNMS